MGKIVDFKKIKAEEKDIRPVNMPEVQHDIGAETVFLSECIKEGYAPQYCPSCGQLRGGFHPYTVQNFECGNCGAKWFCSNADELFNRAYPNAGKEP